MDVRRLLARLRSALLVVIAPRQHAPSDPLAVVAPGAVPAGSSPAGIDRAARGGRRASLVNWVADGRRIRPSRRPRTHISAAESIQGDSRDPATSAPRATISFERAAPRVASGANVPAVPSADGAAHLLASAAPSPAQPASALPPDILVDFTGELSAASLAAIEQLDATQRRLIFLRYLVRQGVYNEGFGARP